MGCAPMAHMLWKSIMNCNPADPSWSNRDRFVLSNGAMHARAINQQPSINLNPNSPCTASDAVLDLRVLLGKQVQADIHMPMNHATDS
jgi:hypothetical protein